MPKEGVWQEKGGHKKGRKGPGQQPEAENECWKAEKGGG